MHNSRTPTDGDQLASAVMAAVGQEMFNLDTIVRFCLVALFTEGHVLLEAMPGMGKTTLVKVLASVLKIKWGRIQFTPDLMPADITGTLVPVPDRNGTLKLEFARGPIFTSLLLADEINRATPKTQSAMLEAMAERQVTVLGTTYQLPETHVHAGEPQQPFMIIATQNPIDQEGTYNLPEAQSDRFMFKLRLPNPDFETLGRIVDKEAGPLDPSVQPRSDGQVAIATDPEWYPQMRRAIRAIDPLPAVRIHILNIVAASGGQFDQLNNCEGQRRDIETLAGLMSHGLGPRAGIYLMRSAKAWKYLFSEEPLIGADPRALAAVVVPVLRHRVKLGFDWALGYRAYKKRPRLETSDPEPGLLESLVADFCRATAPRFKTGRDSGYADLFADELTRIMTEWRC